MSDWDRWISHWRGRQRCHHFSLRRFHDMILIVLDSCHINMLRPTYKIFQTSILIVWNTVTWYVFGPMCVPLCMYVSDEHVSQVWYIDLNLDITCFMGWLVHMWSCTCDISADLHAKSNHMHAAMISSSMPSVTYSRLFIGSQSYWA